jgi:mono/diheme cytochrome c family protein
MPKLITVALLAGIASASFFAFAQPITTTIVPVPIKPTSPASGKQMYATYCAVCHGVKGLGDGPAALAMRVTPPTDLTTLSKKNNGVFPADHIRTVLKFGVELPAHGSSDMPIWGPLMGTLTPGSPDTRMVVNQRINNLTNYLKEIQQ